MPSARRCYDAPQRFDFGRSQSGYDFFRRIFLVFASSFTFVESFSAKFKKVFLLKQIRLQSASGDGQDNNMLEAEREERWIREKKEMLTRPAHSDVLCQEPS
jgi:hypothetical protein